MWVHCEVYDKFYDDLFHYYINNDIHENEGFDEFGKKFSLRSREWWNIARIINGKKIFVAQNILKGLSICNWQYDRIRRWYKFKNPPKFVRGDYQDIDPTYFYEALDHMGYQIDSNTAIPYNNVKEIKGKILLQLYLYKNYSDLALRYPKLDVLNEKSGDRCSNYFHKGNNEIHFLSEPEINQVFTTASILKILYNHKIQICETIRQFFIYEIRGWEKEAYTLTWNYSDFVSSYYDLSYDLENKKQNVIIDNIYIKDISIIYKSNNSLLANCKILFKAENLENPLDYDDYLNTRLEGKEVKPTYKILEDDCTTLPEDVISVPEIEISDNQTLNQLKHQPTNTVYTNINNNKVLKVEFKYSQKNWFIMYAENITISEFLSVGYSKTVPMQL